MSKKNFKGGFDSLFSNTEIEKSSDDEKTDSVEMNDDSKRWFVIKINRLQKELQLWRTGKLNVEIFNESLKENGLSYNEDTNEIE